MTVHILLFITLSLAVGVVHLVASGPHKRSFRGEMISYSITVLGGIVVFTAVIVILTAIFL
ncbi:MAG TPA: hypothetical protein EYN79_10780 [Planctomycetes bacterium]|nr:hypothetical protein [Planctomycetota bacterium]HIN80359.1 hypothetical protein [Planctomycetota bacterium]